VTDTVTRSGDGAGGAPPQRCEVGGHAPGAFRFERPGGAQSCRCFRHALVDRHVVRTALSVATVVGTILTLINQGDRLLHGGFAAEMLWKVPLTYSVPYLVVTYSALRTARVRER